MEEPLTQMPWGERSVELAERASQVLPGAFSRSAGWTHASPLYLSHGRGAHVWDVDGNEYLDLTNNLGALIHGHASAEVVAAVHQQASLGSCFALPTEPEVSLAELLSERVVGFEQVRFCDSEGEAMGLALKAARALTGKPMIAKFEGVAHGTNEFAELSSAPLPDQWQAQPATLAVVPGTPEALLANVLVLPINDFSACRALLSDHSEQVAAIIVDPVPACCGLQPLDSSFLAGLHVLARELSMVLIYDERSAFRLGYGGAQGRFAGAPDLTVLGQIIGGGYPIGAVAGSKGTMAVFAESIPNAGAFAANPISMVAGLASMTLLSRDSFRKLDQVGERVRQSLLEQIRRKALPLQVTGTGSMLMLHPHTRPVLDYRSHYRDAQEQAAVAQLHEALMRRGVIIAPDGAMYLSTALSVADEMRLEDAFEDVLQNWQ